MAPIRKDPAGFKTTELKNARILVNIVLDFEELVLGMLESKGRALAKPLEDGLVRLYLGKPIPLALPAFNDVDFNKFYENVEVLEGFIDKNATAPAAKKIATSSIEHGNAWADKSFARFGVGKQGAVPEGTKPFYLPPDTKMISLYKERIQSEIKGLTSFQSTAIKREITKGFERGETVKQIANRVKGVTQMATRKAITIARTETLAAGNTAALARYEKYGVNKVQWIAAYDDRVCPECEGLHEKIYNIGDEPDLPLHPNCRCTIIPYFGDE